MHNNCGFVGRLTAAPTLRETKNGTPVANFTLAVQRNFAGMSGEKEADFIPIVAWGKKAKACKEHLNKGRLVAVKGSLRIENNEQNGRQYVNPQVHIDSISFLDSPESKEGKKQEKFDVNSPDTNFQEDDEIEDDSMVPF